jgi:hypothetical protein
LFLPIYYFYITKNTSLFHSWELRLNHRSHLNRNRKGTTSDIAIHYDTDNSVVCYIFFDSTAS